MTLTRVRTGLGRTLATLAVLAVSACGIPPGPAAAPLHIARMPTSVADPAQNLQTDSRASKGDLLSSLGPMASEAIVSRLASAIGDHLGKAFEASLAGDRAGALARLKEAKTTVDSIAPALVSLDQRQVLTGLREQLDKLILRFNDKTFNFQQVAQAIFGHVLMAMQGIKETLTEAAKGPTPAP